MNKIVNILEGGSNNARIETAWKRVCYDYDKQKILIPIIAVLFIPVLYAGMFLWAFWDPYDQLDDLPVAVVNLDKGVVYNGKPVEAGKELVDNLKENTGFKWEFVSEKTAKKEWTIVNTT